MKILKLAAIPAALFAVSAYAQPVVVAQPVAVSTTAYNPNDGAVSNTTTQVVTGTRTFFETLTHPAAISAEVGTLGYGANLGWALNDRTELQAGWAGGDVADLVGGDIDVNDVNYDLDTDFSNPYIGIQMRPAANWFTVGTGIIVPDNDIKVHANTNNGYIKVDGVKYNLGNDDKNRRATVDGTVEHRNDIAPYLTIGFRPNINNHWGIFGEIGGAYLGKTDSDVRISGNVTRDSESVGASRGIGAPGVALLPDQKRRLEQRAAQQIDNKDWAEWLPIAKLGLTYRF